MSTPTKKIVTNDECYRTEEWMVVKDKKVKNDALYIDQ